jgi:hypothetical protein
VSVEVAAMFDAITGSDPAATIQQAISAIDATLLNWPDLADNSVICLGGTFGAGSTTNDDDRLVRTISGTLWARRRVVIPPQPTGNIIVSDAGTISWNGIYTPGTTINGRQSYSNVVSSDRKISWSGTRWELKVLPVAYFSGDDVTTPDLATTWQVSGGTAPAPTVMAEMSAPVII